MEMSEKKSEHILSKEDIVNEYRLLAISCKTQFQNLINDKEQNRDDSANSASQNPNDSSDSASQNPNDSVDSAIQGLSDSTGSASQDANNIVDAIIQDPNDSSDSASQDSNDIDFNENREYVGNLIDEFINFLDSGDDKDCCKESIEKSFKTLMHNIADTPSLRGIDYRDYFDKLDKILTENHSTPENLDSKKFTKIKAATLEFLESLNKTSMEHSALDRQGNDSSSDNEDADIEKILKPALKRRITITNPETQEINQHQLESAPEILFKYLRSNNNSHTDSQDQSKSNEKPSANSVKKPEESKSSSSSKDR